MATINSTRKLSFNEKKTLSVFGEEIELVELLIAADDYQVVKLPPDSLLVRAHLAITEVGEAASTVDIGFDGGSEIFSAVALDAVAISQDNVVNVLTTTGKTVTISPSELQTEGKIILILEYIEYKLSNLDLTDYIEG